MPWLIILDPYFWYGVLIAWWSLYSADIIIWILSILCVATFLFLGYKYLMETRLK